MHINRHALHRLELLQAEPFIADTEKQTVSGLFLNNVSGYDVEHFIDDLYSEYRSDSAVGELAGHDHLLYRHSAYGRHLFLLCALHTL